MESMKPDYEARPVAKGRLPDVQGLLFLRERETKREKRRQKEIEREIEEIEGEKETGRDRER